MQTTNGLDFKTNNNDINAVFSRRPFLAPFYSSLVAGWIRLNLTAQYPLRLIHRASVKVSVFFSYYCWVFPVSPLILVDDFLVQNERSSSVGGYTLSVGKFYYGMKLCSLYIEKKTLKETFIYRYKLHTQKKQGTILCNQMMIVQDSFFPNVARTFLIVFSLGWIRV